MEARVPSCCFVVCLWLLALPRSSCSFLLANTPSGQGRLPQQKQPHSLLRRTESVRQFAKTARSSTKVSDATIRSKNKQRTTGGGVGQWLLDLALDSPFWKHVMVPVARQKIIDTAQANGILWKDCQSWLEAQDGPWNDNNNWNPTETLKTGASGTATINYPDWYRDASYHAYETGHLSWKAAIEMELASAAVGARNMPSAGYQGEVYFRRQFQNALQQQAGAVVPENATIVDLGCATGTSTRLLAKEYPSAAKIIGMDLSPYLLAVGQKLLELAPLKERKADDNDSNGTWVCDIEPDDRITYQWGDAAHTGLPENSVDVVNLQFVAHELPVSATLQIIREAARILKENGQLWFCEMDFQAPAYAAQRANPLLFGLIRSTEPFLDEYADGQEQIWACLKETFGKTVIAAATGRHFAVVATKFDSEGVFEDLRFDENGEYRVEDTHLQVWENKKKSS